MDACAEIGPVETGIPMLRPAPRKKGRPKGHYSEIGRIMRALQVGECRLFTTEARKECARQVAYYAGIDILIRKVEGGWRIWRKA